MPQTGGDASRELLDLFGQYESAVQTAREIEACSNLEALLTRSSQQLARDAPSRQSFVTSGALLAVLESLSKFFAVFQRMQDARQPSEVSVQQHPLDGRPAVNTTDKQQEPYLRACQIATLNMRIIRNAMVGCSDAQHLVCRHFDLLVPFLDNITRFHTLNDADAALLSRAAVQMLSNLITANQAVQDAMWPRIVTADRKQDRLVLKLLSSPDTATQSAAQIALINFLRTPAWSDVAHERCRQLCTSASGLQLLESLLSTSESIMLRTASATQDDASQEHEPESEIEGLEESLGFIYTIFAILFERGYASMLVSALAPLEEISSRESDRPVVSSSQLTLLKLLDSWLHLQQKQVAESSARGSLLELSPTASSSKASRGAGLAGLMDTFIHLSRFARTAMASGTAKDGASPDEQPQDRRLFGVHHALLLLLQSLLSLSMTADGWGDESVAEQGEVGFARVARGVLSAMRGNGAFVDELVALLDQTHQYAPALSPFRPAGTTDGDTPARPLPQGHALSATGRAAQSTAAQPGYGFDHLKRDIVRVLGSLVYAPTHANATDSRLPPNSDRDDTASTSTHIRQVQDRIRDRGGLFHVLNMTVLDERNPCKCPSFCAL
ncbi:conserved hypothetical protein [Sporisorium reilianum SRZ2]|uniref:Ataxin-10 domain-containing protein n=1 Tax=Sporisorium reilianum (strain SRZ2) TaxID=999809 RepID=E6ZLZ8_SPORE|nr:conserved hypothetical protein [Sporisorium reilianum SRZ2]